MNVLFPIPVGLNAVNPIIRSLDARSEDLNTIIQPGFINSIKSMGNELDISDLLLVAYNAGTQLFQQSIADGVITLSVYSPGDNSFQFTRVQFVAKGGSDLNPGNTIGTPKLTIQAAATAAGAGGLVWILDHGTYVENVTPLQNSVIYGPNAIISATSGYAINLPDLGIGYGIQVVLGAIETSGSGNPFIVNGSLSQLYINSELILNGTSVINGVAYLNSSLFVHSNITVGASGQLLCNVMNTTSSNLTITTGGFVSGYFAGTTYGIQRFNGHMIFQQDESQETVGRTLNASDSVSTIQFNSVTDDAYVLPATANVAIPIGTVVTFVQLGLGRVNFTDDGISTVINILGAPCSTAGAAAKAFAEKLTDTVWIVSGDIELTTGP